MEGKGVMKYCHVNLEEADNGYILRYSEKKKPECCMHDTYSDYEYKHKELVFKDDELDKAMEKFKSLMEHNKKHKEK